MNDAKSKHGFERGKPVSPRERAWVLRGLGAFLFAAGVVFGSLVIGATFKPLQNVVHRFLEDSVES